MQNWSCMHLCGHSSIKFLWSCDTRAQDSFSYLSQPNVSKICSFINSCIHPSPFWAFGKIFTAFTLEAYTHIFFQKLIMINEFFQRKAGSYLFSKACCFLARQLFIIIIFIIIFLSIFFLFFSCSLSLFFMRYFAT